MNRTIKFRAWSKEGKQFGKPFTLKQVVDISLDDYGGEITNWDNFEFNQFTGLKDKKGQDLYEGDILLINDSEKIPITDEGQGPIEDINHLALVVFENGMFGVKIEETADSYVKGFYNFGLMEMNNGDKPENLEIVGNIYENPELLIN